MNSYGNIFVILILLKVNIKTLTLPLMESSSSNYIDIMPQEMLLFMRRFGYLDPTPRDAETLYHKNAIIEAIKNVQKYGGLQETGTLDAGTMELLSKPRCGVPDIKVNPYYLAAHTSQITIKRRKRFIIGARPWAKGLISYFIANNSLKVPMWQVERDIAHAFLQWSRYSGLKFERVNDTTTNDVDIIIGFGSRYHGDSYLFDGPGNILAHAFYPYEEGSFGGDVHFDDDENWLENAVDLSSGVDFYAVALHELGHSLGLAHSTIYSSIMFPYYKGPENTNLDYDDALAMHDMYLKAQKDVDITIEKFNSTSFSLATIPMGTTFTANTTEVTTTQSQNVDDITSAEVNATGKVNRNYMPSSTTPSLARTLNLCRGHFDAVTVLNGSVHIFKGPYVWELTHNYTVKNQTPLSIHRVFPFLNNKTTSIDAAFVRKDGLLVLFTGVEYWIVDGITPVEKSPRQIKILLHHDSQMSNIDAAILWPKNNRTYIFAGEKFWRMDELMENIDQGYPKPMKHWPCIPYHLDAAVTLTNGKTYFFKDDLYWLYNNIQVRPARGYPRRTSSAWLHCAPTSTMLRNHKTTVICMEPSA